MWYNALLGIHRMVIAGGSFSMLLGAIVAVQLWASDARYADSFAAARNAQYIKIRLAAAETCVPVATPRVTVSDLDRSDVPRLPGSLKLSYEMNGVNDYSTAQTSDEVLRYYLPELSSQCWKLSAIEPGEASWIKDDVVLRIAAQDNPLGGRTIVSYSLTNPSLAVRGYAYKLAQDTVSTPPPTESAPPPPPSDGTQQPAPAGSEPAPAPYPAPTGPYPDPSGTYPQQPYPQQGSMPVCSSDQYMCNGSCVSQGSPCGNFQYYAPGEGSKYPSSYPSGYQQPIQMQPQEFRPGPGPEGQYPGPFGQGQQGQEGEQYRAQFDERRLQDMKRGLEQFSRGVKQMQRMLTRMKGTLTRCGVAIPPELQSAMDEAPTMITAIQNAQSVEDLEQLMDSIPEVGAAMQEWGPQLGEMTRLCEMTKQANREVKNIERRLTQLKNAAKKNQTIQEPVTLLEATVTQMKTAVAEAKQLASGGDVEAAADRLEGGFFDMMEEFWSSVQQIEMMRNLTQGLRQARSELRKAETRIKQLERGKKIDADTAVELRGLLSDIKVKIDEVQAVDRTDAEAVMSLAEELWDRMEAFQDRMEELGQGFYEPTVRGGKERIDIELPDAFKFEASSGGGGGGGFPAPQQREPGF